MQRIVVVDYGMGNLRSVEKAVQHAAPGDSVCISAHPEDIRRADRIVFPGQGAMPDCMGHLKASGLEPVIRDVLENKPVLGICVGMQMLFEHSEEGDTPGLALFAGRVVHFRSAFGVAARHVKVPHMGWNNVFPESEHALWRGIESGTRFYFAHSYLPFGVPEATMAGSAEHAGRFTAAVSRANIFATQFHPEKSHVAGLRLLANFIAWSP